MFATLNRMAKNKNNKPKPQYPSRKQAAYADISRKIWNELEKIIDSDPQLEGRSVSWLVRRELKAFISRANKLAE